MKKEKFIAFFIERRKQLGYSQSKIANELGISDQAVSNWERGISFPDLSYLDDIAKLLQTNVYSLIEGKQKNVMIKEDIIFNNQRFSLYLSKLRKDKNLTQNELGKILGVSGQNISKFENGGFLPSVELIEKYAEYFNVSLLNIYYGLNDVDLYDNITTKENSNKKIRLFLIPCIIIIFLVTLFLFPNLFIEKHLVTVIINDNEIITYKVKDEDIFTLPSLPNITGYDASWDNLDTLITKDKTFTVIYTPKKYTITYSFENKDIEDYVQEVTYGEEYELYIPNDEYFVGYTYYDKAFEGGIYEYDYNISVLGKFDDYRTVTIVLDKDNIQTYSVKINTEITLPSLPNKIGYEASWDNLDTLITEDKAFTVIYTPRKYTITYVFEDDILETLTEEVSYGNKYNLFIPQLSDYSFVGYTYNDEIIENGIYQYDHNITIYGSFSNEIYIIHHEFGIMEYLFDAGYGCSFLVNELELSDYLGECPYALDEYNNYKIIAWKDNNGNIYEVGKTYVYNNKFDLYLSPIFEYYGNAFEVVIENDEAKIVRYNIEKITNLVIPDYIVVNENRYKVIGISSYTFQETYFMNVSFSSNITKIIKNTFRYDDTKDYYVNSGEIYFRGTLKEWFNIEFEEYIVSNSKKSTMRLYLSSFVVGKYNQTHCILEIPEGVEVINPYSCANLAAQELLIPDSVHTIEEHAFIYSAIGMYVNIENVENIHENAFN